MVEAYVELTHQRLRTLENRTSMMVKAIMPVLDVSNGRIADTNQRLTSQYRMMHMAHHRYNLLFRQTYKMLMIHHFALLLLKNYLTIQVGMLQRIHCQYNAKFFFCVSPLDGCILHNKLCDVLGNIVRRCTSSLLGSYVHQELF